jgi:hypothetical protein
MGFFDYRQKISKGAGEMKKSAFLFVLSMLWCGVAMGANSDNRMIGSSNVRALPYQAESEQVIWFSTTIVANTNTQILPNHFVFYGASMTWPSGINYSTTPAKNNGGRLWWGFQAMYSTAAARLHYSFDTDVSTTTDPFIAMGDWTPSDWPFVYQGTVTVRSTTTYDLSGFIITEKTRR